MYISKVRYINMKKNAIYKTTIFTLFFTLTLLGCETNDSGSTKKISVTGVSLSYNTYELEVGKSVTLRANIEPTDATNKNVTWSSSDTLVATVENGKVKGVSTGEAVITVATADGGFTDTCRFTVSPKEEEQYIPDTSDPDIFFVTTSTVQDSDKNKDGEYEYTLSSTYKQIYVNLPDQKVVINLSGATIENSENSPIYVATCDSIDISAVKKTTSYIKDTRSVYTQEDPSQGKGAIFVEDGDLKLKSTGTLDIQAGYYNGIHGKDDVTIQKQTLSITAVNHGIRGNDSVTIKSGVINISCGGDGIHSDNSDISDKGNQRGNVTVNGGTITVNSLGDALSASYNAIFEETEDVVIKFTAKTDKYSSYEGESASVSESLIYLKMSSSTYGTGNYTYAANINGSWYPATYKGTISEQSGGGGGPGGPGGGSRTYYVYQFEKPLGANSFTLYRYNGKVTTYSTSSYESKSEGTTINSSYDMVYISIRSGRISLNGWSNYSNGSSCKGIKAENEIYIKGGTIDIEAYDDGIHANNDGTLENGETPLGNVNISGGTCTIASDDDGVHADGTLDISGGKVTVTKSYEGLEGNIVNVSGGECYATASNDGMNAGSGNSTPSITISGGYLDITVPASGDTDGIDSNGNYTQTGGVVIVKGPGSASSGDSPSSALDTDGSVKLSNCTLIVFGGIEKTPSASGVTKTLCSSSRVSTGKHSISFSKSEEVYETTLTSQTNGCVVYSNLGTATLS